jgi:hypothetical protein
MQGDQDENKMSKKERYVDVPDGLKKFGNLILIPIKFISRETGKLVVYGTASLVFVAGGLFYYDYKTGHITNILKIISPILSGDFSKVGKVSGETETEVNISDKVLELIRMSNDQPIADARSIDVGTTIIEETDKGEYAGIDAKSSGEISGMIQRYTYMFDSSQITASDMQVGVFPDKIEVTISPKSVFLDFEKPDYPLGIQNAKFHPTAIPFQAEYTNKWRAFIDDYSAAFTLKQCSSQVEQVYSTILNSPNQLEELSKKTAEAAKSAGINDRPIVFKITPPKSLKNQDGSINVRRTDGFKERITPSTVKDEFGGQKSRIKINFGTCSVK